MEFCIKVWINKGEILSKDPFASEKRQIDQGVSDNEYAISKENKI